MRGHGLVLHREMARVQRDAPKRWNDHDRAACNAGDALSRTTQRTPTRSSGCTAFSRADTTTWGLLSLGDQGKVQDSTLQRVRCQHARIKVYVVLL